MRPSHDPTYPLFPVFSFIGFLLCLIPLPWHVQAWNSGTCAFMIWTAVSCLIGFVNSLVWTGNVANPSPIWCDISSKIILGVSIGIPAATLCISRRLYYLTSCQTVSLTREDKRRMVMIDLAIAVGIPAIIMILHTVVQGHRFDILEDIGCYPVVYNTLPAYFLYFMWPVVLGVISFVFSGLTLRSFWNRRAQFNQLISSNSSMSISRYLRLVLLAIIDMMCTVPLGIYSIYIGNKGVGLAPWISWEDTHFNFARVALVPSIIWRSDPSFQTSVELTRWLPVLCAFLFFGLFGFASEAQKNYKVAFWAIGKRFGFHPAPPTTVKGSIQVSFPSWKKPSKDSGTCSTGSLPAYIPQSPISPISLKTHRRSQSFSTTFTDVELNTFDVEKGLSSPGLSESSTMYSAPPSYYTRPQPNHVPIDVSVVGEQYDDETLSVPPTPVTPKAKTSNSSLRSILDRVYILSSGNVEEPKTPAPFATSAGPMVQASNAIQVMVHTTETRSTETF
ncbi:pheromone A receptor-domain-containing protein [Crassisporium funariophilum]|nr:pheromone A receptor-domain-containing protein [Crassisporium funariophilum]